MEKDGSYSKLKILRRSARCSVTMRLKSLALAIKEEQSANVRRYMTLAKEAMDKAKECQSNFISEIDEEELLKEIEEDETLTEKWADELYNATEYLENEKRMNESSVDLNEPIADVMVRSEESKRTNEGNVKSQLEARLPLLSLPEFSGDAAEWPSFWERFNSSIHESNLPKSVKVQYFTQSMKGIAAEEVKGVPAIAENYDTIIDTIKRRYGRKRTVIEALTMELVNLKAPLENGTIRPYVINIERIVRNLRAVGLSDDRHEAMTLTVLLNSTSDSIKRRWNERHWNTENVTLTNYLEVLDEMVQRELLTTKKYTTNERRSTHFALPVQTTKGEMSGKYSCFICNDTDHVATKCPLPLSQRRARVQRSKRCTNCLRTGHYSDRCLSLGRCRKCKRKHHTSLCDVQERSITDGSNLRVTSDTMSSALVVSAWTPCSKEAQVLLDTGSDRSFVTEDFVISVDVVDVGHIDLDLNTFGEQTSVLRQAPVVSFRLSDKENGNCLEVEAIVVPKIASVKRIFRRTESEYYARSVDISVLLGNDYCWSVIRPSIGEVDMANIRCVETTFGSAYVGSNEQKGESNAFTIKSNLQSCFRRPSTQTNIDSENTSYFKKKISLQEQEECISVTLPFKGDERPDPNRQEVERRQRRTWKNFSKHEVVERDVENQLMEMKRDGILEDAAEEGHAGIGTDATRVISPLDFLQPTKALSSVLDDNANQHLMAELRFQADEQRDIARIFQQTYMDEITRFRRQRNHDKVDISVGDVVLVNDLGCRRNWPMAVVEELMEGPDGRARAVRLRWSNKGKISRTIRALQCLSPLEKGGGMSEVGANE
ncbi:hypothetical protein SNEBB_007069 [Seison nebaliae]|nr:hypothetical protein SNEBB_007069 [Seison nebaliae]